MRNRNDIALQKGMKGARAYMDEAVLRNIMSACGEILSDALGSRGYQSFTGNTVTSYSCGIYKDGVLLHVFSSGDSLKEPVSRKVRKGTTKFLARPYEGKARYVVGKVGVDSLSGQDSATKALRGMKAPSKKGFSMIVATGTEYSEYLEQVYHYNVLSETLGHVTLSIFEKHRGK